MIWRRCSMLAAASVLAIGAVGAAQQPPERIIEMIRHAEYQFTARGGAFVAPNRAQGFRSRLDGRGLDVTDRMKGAAAWRFHMDLTAWGREGALQTPAEPEMRAEGARVEMIRPGLTEWFVSSPEGLEHGFVIDSRPSGRDPSSPLVLDLAFDGSLRAKASGAGILFETASGSPQLRYGELHVADAKQAVVPSSLGLHGRAIRISIDDSLAVYPLTVDPLMTSPMTTIDGEDPNAHFGFSVASAGDVDGDGYDDLAVGAPNYDNGAHPDGGRVFVFFGSSSGPVNDPQDYWTAEGDHDDSLFGYSVAGAGDINGDTYDDLLIGAPHHDSGSSPDNEGYAFVYYGPLTRGASLDTFDSGWWAHGDKSDSDFGFSVAGAGDVDNDGIADIIIGAPRYQNSSTQNNEGWVFVWQGRNGDDPADDPGDPTNDSWHAQSNDEGVKLGWSVASAGDVDGDGYDDVLAGEPYFDTPSHSNQGRVLVWLGSASGVNGGSDGTPSYEWSLKVRKTGAHLGWSVAPAGDVDGNGAGDVIAGAPDYNPGGAVFLWAGNTSNGLGTGKNLDETDADWSFVSDVTDSRLGSSVASAGLVGGYGVPGVVVAAPAYNGGAVLFWQGCDGEGLASGSAEQVLSPADPEAVAGGGDFNEDGFDDVAVGLPNADPNSVTDAGQALVFGGTDDTPDVTVVFPNGGETIKVADTVVLQWDATNRCDDVPYVNILLSRNGTGGPFTTLFSGLSNDGTESWTVTGPGSLNGILKVVASGPGGSEGEDLSDAVFTIMPNPCLCQTSYCGDEGIRCTFNGNCAGCCHYTCDFDNTCTAPDPIPPGAC